MEGRKAFARLRALGDEKLKTIREGLARGEAASDVARGLHKEGLCKDISEPSLQRQLVRYREAVVVPRLLRDLRSKVYGPGEISTRTLQKLDALSELHHLVELQKARLARACQQEQGSKRLVDRVSSEIKLLHGLLKDVAHLHLEVGLLRRATREVRGRLERSETGGLRFEMSDALLDLYERARNAMTQISEMGEDAEDAEILPERN